MSEVFQPSDLQNLLAMAKSGNAAVTRHDDNSVFSQRQLEFIEQQIMETEYVRLEGEDLVAGQTDVPYFYNDITFKRRRVGGSPVWAHGAPTQIPNVDQDTTEETRKFRQLLIGASWTQREIDAANGTNLGLDISGAQDAVQVLLEKQDDVKFNGDLSINMMGFFDDDEVPRVESAVGLNSNAFTPSQQLSTLQSLVNDIPDNTSSVERPNRLGLDSSAYDYLSNTPMSVDNSISILDQFLLNNGFITQRDQVKRMSKMRSMTLGGVSVGNVACAYTLDPMKAVVKLVTPRAIGSVLQYGLTYVQIYTASISEVIHKKPLAARILTNTGRAS